jgi:hypothetical protein
MFYPKVTARMRDGRFCGVTLTQPADLRYGGLQRGGRVLWRRGIATAALEKSGSRRWNSVVDVRLVTIGLILIYGRAAEATSP